VPERSEFAAGFGFHVHASVNYSLARDAVEPDAEREPYHVVRVHVEEKMPDALLAWQRWSIVGAEEKRTADLVERSRRADAKLAAAVSSQRALAVHSQDRLRR